MNTRERLEKESRLCFLMYVATRKIMSQYTPKLKPLGMTYTQFLVMTELYEKDGQSVGDLCDTLFLDSGTLTPLLKKLEDRGYLTRNRCREDERVVKIFLTDAGREMEPEINRVKNGASCFINQLPEDRQTMMKLLRQMINSMTEG